ncbi:hypothetical protein LCGC14_1770290 [marine sediment metagenome]|uniref:Uncharacterized protein n=1 Tax=marine sediment metagenome TaxID=412755 RepID=A0A0F9HL08_9ZZZZ
MKTKLTAIDIIEVLGNTGKTTFARKGNTALIRRPYGRQVATPAQKIMRDAFRVADAHWAYLSLADRQDWRDYKRWERINGYSQYMKVNITRVRDGLPFIDNPGSI